MRTTLHEYPRGTTLVELVVASVIAIVVLFGVAVLLVDSSRGWSRMYDRAYADVVTDGHVITKRFDAIVRKATADGFSIDADGAWVEVQYYDSDESTAADRYARLSASDGVLTVEYGQIEPRETLTTQTLCTNVSACTFRQIGQSIHMALTLDDGTKSNELVCCGYMHN